MRVEQVAAGLVAVASLLVAASTGGHADGEPAATDVDRTVQVAGVVEVAEPTAFPGPVDTIASLDRDPGTDPGTDAADGTAAEADTTATVAARSVLAGRVIVVDPAHNSGQVGHEDVIAEPVEIGGLLRPCNTIGGATEDGILEAAINWAVAQELVTKLEALGAEVVLTREDDDSVGPCIDERVELATAVDADLVIALHADGWDEDDQGFHVAHAVGELTEATPEVLDEARRFAHLVRDHLVAARFVASELTGSAGIEPRDDLGSLNAATVPSVVVEVGNLLHPEDAALLTSSAGQQRLASALAGAVHAAVAEPAS